MGVIAEAIRHALDDLDLAVDAFDDVGAQQLAQANAILVTYDTLAVARGIYCGGGNTIIAGSRIADIQCTLGLAWGIGTLGSPPSLSSVAKPGIRADSHPEAAGVEAGASIIRLLNIISN
jgi:hypothetical protein